jgi:hypothetical protein
MWTLSALDKSPAEKLRSGRYLARISVDQNDHLKNDPNASLTESDVVGTIEFDGPWNVGWREPKIVDAGNIRRKN